METKILQKWADPSFAYSFTAPLKFFGGLKKLPGFSELSLKQTERALEKNAYAYQPKTWKNHYETRRLDYGPPKMGEKTQIFENNPISGQGIVFQADIFEMPLTEGMAGKKRGGYFLLIVDVWNNYIYAQQMSTKSAKETLATIKKIIKDNNLYKFACLTTDAGGEFVGMHKMAEFKALNIKHFVLTQSKHKAFLSEAYGKIIKDKIYKFMRYYNTLNWQEILPTIVHNLNHTTNRKLGNETSPAEVNSPIFDDYVRNLHAVVARRAPINKRFPNIKENEFKIGDYCYVDFLADAFSKGYHLKRGQLFKITKIDNIQKPYKFYLEDLLGKPLPRFCYAHELKKFYGSLKTHNWPIDHIVGKPRIDKDGKKWYKIR
jgi:hypothetical protein